MLKKTRFSISLIIVAMMFCAFAFAQSGLDAQLERLAAETARIKYIKSDFKQTKYISFMDETLISEGFFSFTAPAELEWRYTSPIASGLVYKDGKAKLWSGDSNKKSSGGGEDALAKIIAEQLIIWTRLDVTELKKTYNISMENESPLTIRLTPKALSPGNPVRDFRLVFNADGITVNQITLFEAEDDYTRIDFFNFEQR